MPAGKKLQRGDDIGQEFYGMVSDQVSETMNLSVQFRSNWRSAKAFKRIYQSVRKAVQTVTVLQNAIALHIIQNLAYLLGRKFMVVEERNESGDRSLEINIVFPERVVRVDKKSLCRQASSSWLLAT